MTRDVDRAEGLWKECLSAAREAQTREVTALAISGLGDVALARGLPEDARERFRDALVIYEQLGFPELQADMCVCLAAAARADGELERAARLLGAGASLRQTTGATETPNPSLTAYVESVTTDGRLELGDEGFAVAFGRGRTNPRELVDEELAQASVSER